MNLARVIGQIWATVKDESLIGQRLLIIQPVTSDGSLRGKPQVAADTVEAGPGDLVYFVTSNEAVFPIRPDFAPVDCSIVGLVDRVDRPPFKEKPLPVKD